MDLPFTHFHQQLEDIHVVILHKEEGAGLGFSIAGGIDLENKATTVSTTSTSVLAWRLHHRIHFSPPNANWQLAWGLCKNKPYWMPEVIHFYFGFWIGTSERLFHGMTE